MHTFEDHNPLHVGLRLVSRDYDWMTQSRVIQEVMMEPGAMVHINEGLEPSVKMGGCGDLCAGVYIRMCACARVLTHVSVYTRVYLSMFGGRASAGETHILVQAKTSSDCGTRTQQMHLNL